jgi:hypothetical protein
MSDSKSHSPPSQAKPLRDSQSAPGLFRFSMTQFLIALILLIVAYPFITELSNGELIENSLLIVLFVSAALAVGAGKWPLTIILIIPAIVFASIHEFKPGLVPIWVITGTQTLFVGFVVLQLLRFILTASNVTTEVMRAGVAGYLMLGILWTPMYLMISELNPNSFSGAHLVPGQVLGRFDALFLSFVSLTCLGCNDLTPLSKPARMSLMVEALCGVLYLAVLIARLVSLYSTATFSRRSASAESEERVKTTDQH